MNWNQLLSTKRFGLENRPVENIESERTQFQRDYDRLIFSSPFRRLQNKTQVFPLPGSVFVHNRLTHSLEVASVGRSLGSIVSNWLLKEDKYKNNHLLPEIGTIVSTACLAHDLGNPPFGHSGEKAIGNFFSNGNGKSLQNDLTPAEFMDLLKYEGNANALRTLTHQYTGRRYGGYALTYSSLASIVKYPCESINGHNKQNIHTKKYGFFQAEKVTYSKISTELGIIQETNDPISNLRHPLVFLVEAADDICYNIIDLEDAHRLGILSFDKTYELLSNFFDSNEKGRMETTLLQLKGDKNEQLAFLRANVINKLIKECADIFFINNQKILDGKYNKSLFDDLSEKAQNAINEIVAISIKDIYKHRSVVQVEIAGYNVLGGLLDEFIGAVLNPMSNYSKMLLQLIPQQFIHPEPATQYQKVMGVIDFIAGMTDVFAVDLYKKIKGESMQLS